MNTINTGEQVVLAMHDGGAVWGTLDTITDTHIIINDIESDDPYTLAKYEDSIGFPISDIRRIIVSGAVFWQSMKNCTSCNVEKSLTDFYDAKDMRDGKSSHCKECFAERGKERYLNGRVFLKSIEKKYGVTRKDAAIIFGLKDKKTVETFVKYTDVDFDDLDKCWNWTGGLTVKGYGQLNITSDSANLSPVLAHRFSYALKNGNDSLPKSIKSGLSSDTVVINHTCHNRKCVNPDHLEAITNRENVSSAKRKPKESNV